jgi:hypothetical protein
MKDFLRIQGEIDANSNSYLRRFQHRSSEKDK